MASGNEANRPVVSVVVATRNRVDRCERLMRALASQTIKPEDFEVVVVDDASGDSTSALLDQVRGEVPFDLRPRRNAVNTGPGAARNIGWRAARAPVVAFIDDDCVPDSDWLEAGLAVMERDPRLGVVQGRTVPATGPGDAAVEGRHTIVVDGPNAFFEACNIFYRRAALEDGGGFAEDKHWWRGWWCEDSFAGWGAKAAGWATGFASDAVVAHDVEDRDLKWWLRASLSQCNEVALASRYPEYRRQIFWRPWSPRRQDAAFVFGVLGLLLACRWRSATLLALPYAWWRRPSIRQPGFVRRCGETVLIDAARTAGNLYGAASHRKFVI